MDWHYEPSILGYHHRRKPLFQWGFFGLNLDLSHKNIAYGHITNPGSSTINHLEVNWAMLVSGCFTLVGYTHIYNNSHLPTICKWNIIYTSKCWYRLVMVQIAFGLPHLFTLICKLHIYVYIFIYIFIYFTHIYIYISHIIYIYLNHLYIYMWSFTCNLYQSCVRYHVWHLRILPVEVTAGKEQVTTKVGR